MTAPPYDILDVYARATAWTGDKIANVSPDQLDSPTTCDEWDVRAVINHCLAVQRRLAAAAGQPTAPRPAGASAPPPELVGEDPGADYARARQAVLAAYRNPEAAATAAQTLAIGPVDQLVHGWDIATSTGQDATMPPDLAEIALRMIDGRLGDDWRGPGRLFKAVVDVPDDASFQDRLLGYGGRRP